MNFFVCICYLCMQCLNAMSTLIAMCLCLLLQEDKEVVDIYTLLEFVLTCSSNCSSLAFRLTVQSHLAVVLHPCDSPLLVFVLSPI